LEKAMTPEERQMLASLFERVGSTAANPRDAQAEAFIDEAVRAQPHASYVLAQTVLVQQQALENASHRLAELEAQLKEQAAPQQETSFLGNLGRSMFGGGQPAPTPAPRSNYDANASTRQPAYPTQPGYAPPPPPAGPWGAQQQAAPSGGGFMQSALTTAAGVAGGALLAHSLGSLFGGQFGAGSREGGETINNYYETAPDAAGQHAQDVLQDQDQDQDDAQDASDDNSGDDDGSYT
jgi:uncharacterized protein